MVSKPQSQYKIKVRPIFFLLFYNTSTRKYLKKYEGNSRPAVLVTVLQQGFIEIADWPYHFFQVLMNSEANLEFSQKISLHFNNFQDV